MASRTATSSGPSPENSGARPENGAPNAAAEVVLDDLRIRAIGIPLFGIVIPNLTGLFGSLGPGDLLYWIGYAWFVLLSAFIWQGNRFFLVQQRRHYDWFSHPIRKLSLLLFANVFYTAPLTVAMLAGWYRVAPFAAMDWNVVRVVTLANVICVIFITHVYETVYLIQQREDDRVAVARLDQARAQAELAALKAQVDPHFLFNSLNTLAHLIPHDPVRALEFTEGLADIYRYLLMNRSRDLVPVADELSFVRSYVALLRLRFGDAVRLDTVGAETCPGALVVPISLQVAVENAVKHNVFDRLWPLDVRVCFERTEVTISHLLREKAVPGSAGTGLANLDERCRRVTGRGVVSGVVAGSFRVVLPLLRTAA